MTDRVLPTGTVTFLFSDIEGSTRLVQELGPAVYTDVLERHHALLRAAFARHGGVERGTQGDSFLVVFREATPAVAAAVDAQRAIAAEPWPHDIDLRVRMGMHTGIGARGGDDYVGVDINRAARIAGAAHGGQVLLSDTTRALVERELPPGVELRGLGQHRLKDLARPEDLHQLVIEGLVAIFAPLRTAIDPSASLPARVTSFVGRDADIAEVDRLLRAGRLVTLTGPGGTGKTSLALEVARRWAHRTREPAWFVPLAAIAEPARVPAAIAASLGIVEAPGRSATDQVLGFLEGQSVLLVLDNFEQLLDASDVVGELIAQAPWLRLLVTSRAPLRIATEQEYDVAPLAVPASNAAPGSAQREAGAQRAAGADELDDALASPAVQLFVERAARVRPGYRLELDDASAVASICRQLDGLPLGIELAAARMALLPPQAIAARLASRLDLPGQGIRDLPERQRTLEAAIGWSYELLDPPARRLLARLSVFTTGFGLDAAEAVCGPASDLGVEVIDGLSELVDHSLIQAAPGSSGARFLLLETIRRFAGDRLETSGEGAALRRRHAETFLALAEAAAPSLAGPDTRRWLDRLRADEDNLRASLRWAIDAPDADIALRLGASMWRFWQVSGRIQEGLAAMDAVLTIPGSERPTEARMWALAAAGGLRWWGADIPTAHELYVAQHRLAGELGSVRGAADALFNLAHTSFVLHRDYAEGSRLLDEAEALFRELGDQQGIARLDFPRAFSLIGFGNLEEARDAMLAAHERFTSIGDALYAGIATGALSEVLLMLGDLDGALRWGLRAFLVQGATGDVAATTIAMRSAGVMFLVAGLLPEAATATAAFTSLCRRFGVQPPDDAVTRVGIDWSEDQRDALEGRGVYAEAARRGAAMSVDEAVDYVRRLANDILAARGTDPLAPDPASTAPAR